MTLPAEAIIAIAAIVVSLPPTVLVVWRLLRRVETTNQDGSGKPATLLVINLFRKPVLIIVLHRHRNENTRDFTHKTSQLSRQDLYHRCLSAIIVILGFCIAGMEKPTRMIKGV